MYHLTVDAAASLRQQQDFIAPVGGGENLGVQLQVANGFADSDLQLMAEDDAGELVTGLPDCCRQWG